MEKASNKQDKIKLKLNKKKTIYKTKQRHNNRIYI